MGDEKKEGRLGNKKKLIFIIAFLALVVFGGAYLKYMAVSKEAKYYNTSPKNLEKVKDNLRQERF